MKRKAKETLTYSNENGSTVLFYVSSNTHVMRLLRMRNSRFFNTFNRKMLICKMILTEHNHHNNNKFMLILISVVPIQGIYNFNPLVIRNHL
jgi:5-methylcytosine-specific restriction endonuclease McrBC regulatory subunit McrC